MSTRVLTEAFEHSQARGIDRLVLLALADCAHHDGVTWLQIESPTGKRSITTAANCSRAAAFRAIDALVDLGELQVVKVRRHSSFINVYRVQVGRIIGIPIDYSRLPFDLPHPFGEGLNLRPSTGGQGAMPDGSAGHRHGNGSGSHPETVAGSQPGDSHGLTEGTSRVSASRARVAKEGPVLDPSRIQGRDTEQADEEIRLARARAALSNRVVGLRLNRKRGFCAECEVGGGHHATDCRSARETTRQAYERFIDEAAGDPDLPLEEIRAVVETWHDIDDVDRQELLERAETLRDPDQAKQAAA